MRRFSLHAAALVIPLLGPAELALTQPDAGSRATACAAQQKENAPAADGDDYYSATLEKIVGTPKETRGRFIITVELNRKIPNDTGRIVFADKKYAEIDEYTPAKGPVPKETNRIVLVLDPSKAPLGAKSPDELRKSLPAKVKVHLRRNKPRRPEAPPGAPPACRGAWQVVAVQFGLVRPPSRVGRRAA
jgi:hypothetical protein